MSKIKRFCSRYKNKGIKPAIIATQKYIKKRANLKFHTVDYGINNLKLKRKYGNSLADPFDLIYIDPTEVDYLLVPRFVEPSHIWTSVCDGNWDISYSDKKVNFMGTREGYQHDNHILINFDNFTFYSSIRRHFKDKVPWENTEIYNFFIENNISNRYSNEKNIRQQLSKLDWLYNSIKEEGYKTQRELRSEDNLQLKPNQIFKNPEAAEVWVHIGRDGKVIFCTGRHRFSIAKILELEKIPVKVHVRHKSWQDLRHTISSAESKDQLSKEQTRYLDHPDLHDIINKKF